MFAVSTELTLVRVVRNLLSEPRPVISKPAGANQNSPSCVILFIEGKRDFWLSDRLGLRRSP